MIIGCIRNEYYFIVIAVVKPKAKTGLVRVHATMSKSSRDAKLVSQKTLDDIHK